MSLIFGWWKITKHWYRTCNKNVEFDQNKIEIKLKENAYFKGKKNFEKQL